MTDNFIVSFEMEDSSLCDRIIDLYHAFDHLHYPGICGDINGGVGVNKDFKKSTDLCLEFEINQDCLLDYFDHLRECMNKYVEIFPLSGAYSTFDMVEAPVIQWYKPNEGFTMYHCERSIKGNDRHLAFMTYLNDVTDNGETEFLHQNLKLKCKKGLTTIWPVDWTHTHRGVVSKTQSKYIITGWLSFT
jgi:hypothetical protein